MSLFESASLVVTPNGTKASKLYAIKPTSGAGDLSVTRATTATRVNSAGLIESVAVNVPRLDYTDSTCPSILVEPQRTNLVTYSEDLSNSNWGKVQTSISVNSTISPDGNSNADKIIENTNYSDHAISQFSNFTSGITYTVSFYAKKSERTKIRLASAATSQTPTAEFDLNAMTANPTASSFNASIVNAGNGWVKCSVSKTANTTTFDLIYFAMVETFAINSYTGNGTSGLYIWGAQLEAGSYATSYIPTTSASVTRNADVISKTGISDLIGQTDGTIFVDAIINTTNESADIITLFNQSNVLLGAYVLGYNLNGNITLFSFPSNNLVVVKSGDNRNTRIKLAFSYSNNDFTVYINGIQTYTSSTLLLANNLSALYINSNSIPSNFGIGNYKSVALWKTRLTNAELAELTTL